MSIIAVRGLSSLSAPNPDQGPGLLGERGEGLAHRRVPASDKPSISGVFSFDLLDVFMLGVDDLGEVLSVNLLLEDPHLDGLVKVIELWDVGSDDLGNGGTPAASSVTQKNQGVRRGSCTGSG